MEATCNTTSSFPCRSDLTRGDSIGLAFVAQSGLVSLAAVLVLFVLIGRNIIRHATHLSSHQWKLINGPFDAYMLSLFVSDMLQALGAVLDVKWVNQGFVETGPYCIAQGFIQQIGETSVAMTTLAIALHTFIGVVLGKGTRNLRVALLVIAFIWAFVILCTILGLRMHGADRNFQPTPYWCWINGRFLGERIIGEYLWLWLALFGSFALYLPLFLWSNGNITMPRESWWPVRFHFIPRDPDLDERARPKANSLAILAYPVVYSIVVLPFCAVRWVGFAEEARHHGMNYVPPAATFAVAFIYGLSGFMNVLLLILTRPNLLLFGNEAYKDYQNQKNKAIVNVRYSQGEAPDSPFPRFSDDSRKGRRRAKSEQAQVMKHERLNVSSESGWGIPMIAVEEFQWPQQPPNAVSR